MFIYPNNLKEKKMFLFLVTKDLAILGILLIVTVYYSSRIISLWPMAAPLIFGVVKVRFLEHNANLWEYLVKCFNYLLNEQQEYFWRRK